MEVVSQREDLFTYDELEQPDSFRLLKIKIDDTGELSCELVHSSLKADSLPNYSALSYVWGNPLMERPITCNGKTKYITVSLETALKHVVKHNPHDYLWADQLCIDQLNGEERAQQVNIMGAIFQVSRFVMAFLGPETVFTAPAVDLIKRISYVAEKIDDSLDWYEPDEGIPTEPLTVQHRTTLNETKKLGISYAATDEWHALHYLFDNPWFERIWIVQEMLPCQEQQATYKIEARCIIGSHTLWWDDIKYAAKWISYKGERRPRPPTTPKVDGLRLTMGMRLRFESRISYGFGEGPPRGKFSYRTLDLLNRFRDRNATDPRDKVYGLLGLSSLQETVEYFANNPKISVDYRKSVMEVYRDIAMALITDKKNLVILLSATPHSEEPGWPTWLPDWRIRDLSDIGAPLRHKTPDGGIPMRIKDPPSPNVLHVEGKILGTATFVHSARHSADVLLNADARVLRQHVVDLLGATYHPTGESTATAFTLTLSCGQVLQSVLDAGTSVQEFADLVLDYIDAFKPPKEDPKGGYRDRSSKDFKERGFSADWTEIYDSSLCERRVFVTETGYVGLGYHHMVEGDVVAILFGLPVACMLRHRGDRGVGWYEFVGEAYARGAMDGEVVRDLEKNENGLVIGDEFFLV